MRTHVRRLVEPLSGDTTSAAAVVLSLLGPRLDDAPRRDPLCLVIVSGIPGSGKSTMARAIAPIISVPYLDRDELKDALFDTLGWSDRAWSMRVGSVSWDLMYLFAQRALTDGRTVLLESNFDKRFHPDRLAALRIRVPHRLVEVHCSVSHDVARQRFWRRWDEGGRHPGHVQAMATPRDAPWRPWPTDPPTGMADALVRVDTTDPATVDVDTVAAEVRRAIEEGT